jgi:hypothetical protein
MAEIDLVDWTIQEAQNLKIERREPGDVSDKSSLDKLLAVLEGEPAGRTDAQAPAALIAASPNDQPTVEEPVAIPTSEAVVAPKPVSLSGPPTSSATAEAKRGEHKSTLLMAIVEPDIYTARADRDRAVALRWVLRDIKNNRLKWSPVGQDDLRILIEMGLVEMRDSAPKLTNAGASAII